jgi:hypothetical protein
MKILTIVNASFHFLHKSLITIMLETGLQPIYTQSRNASFFRVEYICEKILENSSASLRLPYFSLSRKCRDIYKLWLHVQYSFKFCRTLSLI